MGFNDGVSTGCGVTGLVLVPCCLPPKKDHVRREFRYHVGNHCFTAPELHKREKGGTPPYNAYCEHLLKSIETEEKSLERIAFHTEQSMDQNMFIFSRAPFWHAS